MKKQYDMRSQSQVCVLRVNNIHCDGCKGKIRKLLKKIDGVYGTSIDVEQGKVTVTGNVDPAVLIKKLEKLGKHAELWRSQKGANYSKSVQFDLANNQFKNLQMGKMKDGKDHRIGYESVKGSRDLKVPLKLKDQRAVRFDLSKKDHVFDDFSGDEFDDDDYDYEDEEFDEEEDEFGYGGHQSQHSQKKVMPIKGNNGNVSKKLKKGGVKAKKGGGGLMSMIGKVIGGKRKGKDGNVGKKGGRGGGGGGGGGGKNKGGGNGGGEGKIGNKAGGGGGGGKKGGGGKNGMYSDFEITNTNRNNGGSGGGGRVGGGGGGKGQYQVPVTRGPPAPPMVNMNGGNGYYPGGTGVGPMMAGNPYHQQQQQQQQYMAMMMNQQRMMNGGGGGGRDMHHMAMYGRPPPGYGFMAPPPPAYHDPYTHMFSDENTDSCSIM